MVRNTDLKCVLFNYYLIVFYYYFSRGVILCESSSSDESMKDFCWSDKTIDSSNGWVWNDHTMIVWIEKTGAKINEFVERLFQYFHNSNLSLVRDIQEVANCFRFLLL